MSALRKILQYAEEYKHKLYMAIFLIFGSVIVGIIPYLLIYDMIIRFIEMNDITLSYLMMMAILIMFFLWFKMLLFIKGLTASHEVAFDTLMGIRTHFAEKLMTMPLGEIHDKGTGSYKKNFVDDIEYVELLIAHMLPEGIPYVLTSIIVYAILFIVDWRLALLAMLSLLIGLVAVMFMMKAAMSKVDAYYQSAEKMNATIVEYISGMDVIKIFNQTTNSFDKYVESVNNYKTYTLEWYKSAWKYRAIYGSILPSTILFLLPVGTYLYIQGTLSLSVFVFALLLSMSLGIPLLKLVEFSPIIPMLKHKIDQLDKAMDGEPLEVTDREIMPKQYDVEFKNVTFAYKQKDVIKNVSFNARENNVTAIVGASGSGKSTLAKLLVHFWDTKYGEIKIGGVNVKDLSFEKLMKMISYVSQDTFLFNTTILENIRIGNPNASDDEVKEAAKLAMCHDFIVNMDKGYDSIAGDAGNKLSGGEKQRITLARAILKNAPIIVLDEATASTDAENEDKIHEALNELLIGKTVIVIAHRLSTIVEADQIVVMNEGRLLMEGTHQELLERCQMYQELWNAHIQTVKWDIHVKEVAFDHAKYSK